MIFTVVIGSLLSILIIRRSLGGTDWSLADALSEGTELTLLNDKGQPVTDDKTKEQIKVTKLCSSSSRMIAMMGMIVILLMFLGFGAFSLFTFVKTGKMPESMEDVVSYLVAGVTLFASYMVNKFSKIFEGLTK